LLVIGGLYTGWFTPTEAAGVGAFGAFVITLVKKRLTWENFRVSLTQTGRTTAMVFLILIGAHVFGYFLTISQIPDQLSIFAAEWGLNNYIILSLIVLAYIIMGCFMEGLALMVLSIPIVYPMVHPGDGNEPDYTAGGDQCVYHQRHFQGRSHVCDFQGHRPLLVRHAGVHYPFDYVSPDCPMAAADHGELTIEDLWHRSRSAGACSRAVNQIEKETEWIVW
jgi:hypothetical protein